MRHAQNIAVALVIVALVPAIAQCDDSLRKQGDTSYAAKNYKQAISQYTKAIQQDDTDHRSYYWRGQAHEQLKEYGSASADFSKAALLQPTNANYQNELAWLLATAPSALHRDGRRAVATATKACELTELKNAMYLDTLAAAFAEAGDFVKARQYQLDAWKLCEEKHKEDFQSRLVLYRADKPYRQGVVSSDYYRRQGDKSCTARDYGQAIAHYKKAIEQDSKDHSSFFWRGYCNDKTQEYTRASSDYAQAVSLQPDNPLYLNGFAWFLATNPSAQHRDGNRALAAATKACTITSFNNALYVDTLAATYAEVGNFAKARQYQLDAWKLCDKKDSEDFYSRLFLFRANRPYRQQMVISVSGPVYFDNRTNETLTIDCRYYIDRFGKTERPNASWRLRPGFSGYLQLDGERVVARSFHYTMKSSGGSSEWKSLNGAFDADGDLYLPITGGDLLTASRDTTPSSGTTTRRSYRTPPTGVDSEATQRAILKILGAGLANEFAKDQDQKEGLLAALFSVGARAGRDNLIESALRDVFPDLDEFEIRSVRLVASLYVDGKLSLENLGKEAAKQEIIAALKREDPSLGTSAQVVDFLYDLGRARADQKRRN